MWARTSPAAAAKKKPELVRLSSCREQVIGLCREAGFEPKISFQSEDYEVIKMRRVYRDERDLRLVA